MKLYQIKRKESADFEAYDGFIILAKTAAEARKIATEKSGYEGFLDPKKSACSQVDMSGKSRIVLKDYRG